MEQLLVAWGLRVMGWMGIGIGILSCLMLALPRLLCTFHVQLSTYLGSTMYEEGAWPGRPYSAMLTFGIPAHCAGCPICYSVAGGLAL